MPRGFKTRETGELLLSKITQKNKPSPLHFAAPFLWEPHGLGSGSPNSAWGTGTERAPSAKSPPSLCRLLGAAAQITAVAYKSRGLYPFWCKRVLSFIKLEGLKDQDL